MTRIDRAATVARCILRAFALSAMLAGAVGLECIHAGADPSTPATYTIAAVGRGGERGAATTFTTDALPPPPTKAPTVTHPPNNTVSGFIVEWTPTTFGIHSTVTGYAVVRDGSVVGATAASVTRYEEAGLVPGVPYAYAIAAVNAFGTGRAGAPSVAVARGPAQASATSGTGARFAWDSWAGASFGYRVLVDGREACRTLPIVPGATPWARADAAGPTTLVVSWGAPPRAGNATLDWGYEIRRNGTLAAVVADSTNRTYVDWGRTPGVLYAYEVAARSAAGTGLPATCLGLADAPPGPPAGVLAGIDAALLTAVVSWDPPLYNAGSSIRAYAVQRNGSVLARVPAGTLAYADATIVPGSSYLYAVAAENAAGASAFAAAPWPANTASRPSAPATLVAAAVNGTAVRVSWSAAEARGGSPIEEYRLYRSGRFAGVIPAAAPTREFVDANLEPLTPYAYEVAAADAAGEGPRSAPASARPDAPPNEPRSFAALALGATAVALSWVPPAADGRSPVLGYTVYRDGAAIANVTAASHVDAGRVAGTEYGYAVLAYSARGAGPPAPTVRVVPDAAPAAPRNLSVVATSSSSVAVSWAAPAPNGGTPILDYAVLRNGSSTPVWVGDRDATRCDETGLVLGSAYEYAVYARNAAGAGPAARAVVVPDALPPRPEAPRTTVLSGTQVLLEWSAPPGHAGTAILGYLVRVNGTLRNATAAGQTACVLGGLVAGSSHALSVAARNAMGSGPASPEAVVVPDSVPGPPAPVSAAVLSASAIRVAWGAPAPNGGSALLGFRVRRANAADVVLRADLLSYDDASGVGFGTERAYEVVAFNRAGDGPPSAPATARVGTRAEPPRAVSAAALSPGSASVAWEPPLFDGGSAVVGYVVRRDGAVANRTGPGARSFEDRNVTLGTAYAYVVLAVTAAGEGLGSDAAVLLFDFFRDPPGGVVASRVNSTRARVTWTEPAGGRGTEPRAYVVRRNGTEIARVAPGIAAFAEDEDPRWVNVVYTVATENWLGVGTPSPPAAPFYTLPATPTEAPILGAFSSARMDVVAPQIAGAVRIHVYRNGTRVTPGAGAALAPFLDLSIAVGTPYAYAVSGINAVGVEGARSPNATLVSKPGAVSTRGAVVNSATSVTVFWTAPSAGTVSSYKVYQSPGGLSYGPFPSTTFSASIANLTTNVPYSFNVVAITSGGEGGGAPFSVTPNAAPNAPLLLAAAGDAFDSVRVEWSVPPSNGGTEITKYTLYYGGSSIDLNPWVLSRSVTGLAFLTYEFYVTASNAAGTSPASNRLRASPDILPNEPRNVASSVANGTALQISWSAPTINAGSAALGYNVYHNGTKIGTAAVPPYTDAGLVPGATYAYTVRAYNQKGEGSDSKPTVFGTPDAVPGPPTGVAFVWLNRTGLGVSWSAPVYVGTAVRTYTVYADGRNVGNVTAPKTSLSVYGLTCGFAYAFSVYAANSFGVSATPPASVATLACEPPGPPLNFWVTSLYYYGASLSWSAPASNGSANAATAYSVFRNRNAVPIASLPASATSFYDGNLAGGTYEYSIRAENLAGPSPLVNISIKTNEFSPTFIVDRATFATIARQYCVYYRIQSFNGPSPNGMWGMLFDSPISGGVGTNEAYVPPNPWCSMRKANTVAPPATAKMYRGTISNEPWSVSNEFYWETIP